MERFFWLREDRATANKYGGSINAAHRWGLPGLSQCPTCAAGWAAAGHYYPGVDLKGLGEDERDFRKARQEPFAEFRRLRELVRTLVPLGAEIPPGTTFGPLVGTCTGQLPDFAWSLDVLLAHRNVLDGLRGRGVRELAAFATELRARHKTPPEILEVQLAHRGQLHPDCIPVDVAPPCPTCGRFGLSRPEEPILDAASLPSDLDLFRLGNFATMIVCTERFLDAVSSIEGDGLSWRELPIRARRVGDHTSMGVGEHGVSIP
ncbi:double-CXXCG motif protein [Myxococcus stipitatus]|uniref:SitI6 family double-CXXCG motif immunity protein n=1 Tax=Myxococcus stipitatus TaxID=83455 RepID=UPI0030D57A6E